MTSWDDQTVGLCEELERTGADLGHAELLVDGCCEIADTIVPGLVARLPSDATDLRGTDRELSVLSGVHAVCVKVARGLVASWASSLSRDHSSGREAGHAEAALAGLCELTSRSAGLLRAVMVHGDDPEALLARCVLVAAELQARWSGSDGRRRDAPGIDLSGLGLGSWWPSDLDNRHRKLETALRGCVDGPGRVASAAFVLAAEARGLCPAIVRVPVITYNGDRRSLPAFVDLMVLARYRDGTGSLVVDRNELSGEETIRAIALGVIAATGNRHADLEGALDIAIRDRTPLPTPGLDVVVSACPLPYIGRPVQAPESRSLGLATAIATRVALKGRTLDRKIAATGMVSADGYVGRVETIPAKVRSLAHAADIDGAPWHLFVPAANLTEARAEARTFHHLLCVGVTRLAEAVSAACADWNAVVRHQMRDLEATPPDLPGLTLPAGGSEQQIMLAEFFRRGWFVDNPLGIVVRHAVGETWPDLAEVLQSQRTSILMTGESGSGKTLHLDKLWYDTLQGRLPFVPIRLRRNDLLDLGDRPSQRWKQKLAELTGASTDDISAMDADEIPLLVIVDGLENVDQRVLRRCSSFLLGDLPQRRASGRTEPMHRVVVALPDTFVEARLDDLDGRFKPHEGWIGTDTWRTVRPQGLDPDATRAAIQKLPDEARVAALLDIVDDDVLRHPLLFGMAFALSADPSILAGGDRGALFVRYVEGLLARSGVHADDRDLVRGKLEDLALVALEERSGRVTWEQVAVHLPESMRVALLRDRQQAGTRWNVVHVERSILYRSGDRFAFVHDALTPYLASRALARNLQPDLTLLLRLASSPALPKALELFVRGASPATRRELVSWASKAGQTEAVLAARALADGTGKEHIVRLFERGGGAGPIDLLREKVETAVRVTIRNAAAALASGRPFLPVACAGVRLASLNTLVTLLRFMGSFDHGEHPESIEMMRELAFVFLHDWREKEARDLLERVLRARQRSLGRDHPDTIRAASELAHALAACGKAREAYSLHRQLFEVKKRVFGADHQDTLETRLALVRASWESPELNAQLSAMWADRDFESAERLERHVYEEMHRQYEDILDRLRRTVGVDHPLSLTTMHHLASNLEFLGREDEAKRVYERAVRGMRRTFGEEHPTTLACMSDLAGIYNLLEQPSEARELLKHVLRGRRSVYGDEHPETLTAMSRLHAVQRGDPVRILVGGPESSDLMDALLEEG